MASQRWGSEPVQRRLWMGQSAAAESFRWRVARPWRCAAAAPQGGSIDGCRRHPSPPPPAARPPPPSPASFLDECLRHVYSAQNVTAWFAATSADKIWYDRDEGHYYCRLLENVPCECRRYAPGLSSFPSSFVRLLRAFFPPRRRRVCCRHAFPFSSPDTSLFSLSFRYAEVRAARHAFVAPCFRRHEADDADAPSCFFRAFV